MLNERCPAVEHREHLIGFHGGQHHNDPRDPQIPVRNQPVNVLGGAKEANWNELRVAPSLRQHLPKAR